MHHCCAQRAAYGEDAAPCFSAPPSLSLDNPSHAYDSPPALPSHFPPNAGGSVRAVKVAKKKGPDGKVLSAGFGFVECSSEAAAKAAVKALQGSTLDGHKLVLQLSLKKGAAGGATPAAAGGKRKKSMLPDTPKMVVRNVAFEATRKDILGLFTPFGAVKSCRLPRKFDGTHRWAGGPGGRVGGRRGVFCRRKQQAILPPTLPACSPAAHLLVWTVSPGSALALHPPELTCRPPTLPSPAGALPLWTSPPSRRRATRWTPCRARTCTAAAWCWSGRRRRAGWTSCAQRRVGVLCATWVERGLLNNDCGA